MRIRNSDRYLPDERRAHAAHYDGHAFATAVLGLTEPSEYRGTVRTCVFFFKSLCKEGTAGNTVLKKGDRSQTGNYIMALSGTATLNNYQELPRDVQT